MDPLDPKDIRVQEVISGFSQLTELECKNLIVCAQANNQGGIPIPEPLRSKAVNLRLAHTNGRLRSDVYRKLRREENADTPIIIQVHQDQL